MTIKNIKRSISVLLGVVILTGLLVFSINLFVKHTAVKHIISAESIKEDGQYDCILVLGCGVRPDGSPTPMLADRLQRAIELYKMNAAPKIIMSGDHGTKGYDEVNCMREYAISAGIAEEDIFMDHAGFSTYESMYRAKKIFCAEKPIIVTQKYHLYRAVYIANRLDLNVCGVASDYRSYYGQLYRDLREVAARCKDFLTCIFRPEPTFLGGAIPVNGDGTVTKD